MRLIDADSIPWDVEGVGEIPVITKDEIDQLPTINIPTAVGESVGVIRCKDCKHRPKDNGIDDAGFRYDFPDDYRCPCRCEDGYYSWMPDDDWYCANAERKDE